MKKLALLVLPLAFAIAACDGARENEGEEIDKANGEGELMGKGPAEEAGEMLDKEADATADEVRKEADAIADGLESGEIAAPSEEAVVQEMADEKAAQ